MRVTGVQKFILAVFVLLFLCPAVKADVVDRIVAVVNDDIITLAELNAAFAPYASNIEESYKGPDKAVFLEQQKALLLRQMVDAMLIEQEAKKAGAAVAVTDDEIEEVFRNMLVKNNVTMEEYTKRIASEGQTLQGVKKDIRSQMLRMRLLRREVQSRVLVTDEEIGQYYDRHKDKYEGKEAVRLFQLFLPLPQDADAATRRRITALAKEMHQRILKAERMEDLIAQGPAGIQAGDVGFIQRGTILPEVEKAAFGLETGQISDVIESEVGLHIIRVVDKRGAGLKPIEIVREEIKAIIEEEKVAKKYDEWIEDVRKKAFIDIRL